MVYWNKNSDLSDFYPVVKTRVKNCKNLPRSIRTAGIILYTYHKDEIIFGLGTHNATHHIVDFSTDVKSPDNIFNLLLKNLDRQLLNVFDILQLKDIMECPVIYNKERLILFIHLNIDPDDLSEKFIQKYVEHHDICCITWFTPIDFNHNIANKNNFEPYMKDFLLKAQDFSYLL